MGFIALTVATLLRRWWEGRSGHRRDTLIGGELPGLPLVLMHSACWGCALARQDWLSVALFAWWGPGFLVVAGLVLAKRRVPWWRLGRATSILCKVLYLALVGLLLHHGQPAPVFAYSLWIMHDQVRLAWLQGNADRTRRIGEDWWLPRICYPLFLGLPLVTADVPWRWASAAVAALVLVLWLWGLGRLVRRRGFRAKPLSFTENLRDIVYLERPAGG